MAKDMETTILGFRVQGLVFLWNILLRNMMSRWCFLGLITSKRPGRQGSWTCAPLLKDSFAGKVAIAKGSSFVLLALRPRVPFADLHSILLMGGRGMKEVATGTTLWHYVGTAVHSLPCTDEGCLNLAFWGG